MLDQGIKNRNSKKKGIKYARIMPFTAERHGETKPKERYLNKCLLKCNGQKFILKGERMLNIEQCKTQNFKTTHEDYIPAIQQFQEVQ